MAYDGRKEEPVTLPVKFPLLLAQGADGIAVGLASKILPHNFVELINASIAYLRGEEFQLVPDFQTGGIMDASNSRTISVRLITMPTICRSRRKTWIRQKK